jgi:di/tricarboxylate transporter/CRP-like cAMP-binding protein
MGEDRRGSSVTTDGRPGRGAHHGLTAGHVELLRRVDLFKRLDRVALARLAGCVEPVVFEAGQVVCRRGDRADALYVVTDGVFGVYYGSPNDDDEHRVAEFATGGFFGEMALLGHEPRSATVRAESQGEVLRVDQERFLALLQKDASVASMVAAELGQRLREGNARWLQHHEATGRVVDVALDRLTPDRRGHVLRASVLEEASLGALEVLFGEGAELALGGLREAGIEIAPSSSALLHEVRRRFEREAGAAAAGAWSEQAASCLLEAGRWNDALAILARIGARAAFVAALGRGLRGDPPLPLEQARRWLDHLSADEAALDTQVALARASFQARARGAAAGAPTPLDSTLVPASQSTDRIGGLADLARAAGSEARHRLRGGLARAARAPRVQLIVFWLAIGCLVGGLAVDGQTVRLSLLLLAAVLLWAIEIVPSAAVALGLVAAWVLAEVPPASATSGFASLNWLFVVTAMAVALTVLRSGLLFRLGLVLTRRLRVGLFGQAGTLLLMGVLFSPLLPQNQARAAVAGPIALTVAEARGLGDREPAAAVLGLATWIGAGPMMFLFLNGSPLCLMAWGLLPESSRNHFGWLEWLLAALPLGVIVGLVSLVALIAVFRPRGRGDVSRSTIDVQLGVLGRLSEAELAAMLVVVVTVVGFVLAPLAGVDVRVVGIVGVLVAVAVGALDRKALQELDWNYLLFLGVVLSIPAVLAPTGLDAALASAAGELLGRLGGAPALVLSLALATMLVRLVLDQFQALALLQVAVTPVGLALGVDPWVVAIVILAASPMWFLPTQTNSYLAMYAGTDGRLFSHTQAWRACLAYALITLLGLGASIPYWRMLGLL